MTVSREIIEHKIQMNTVYQRVNTSRNVLHMHNHVLLLPVIFDLHFIGKLGIFFRNYTPLHFLLIYNGRLKLLLFSL